MYNPMCVCGFSFRSLPLCVFNLKSRSRQLSESRIVSFLFLSLFLDVLNDAIYYSMYIDIYIHIENEVEE